MEGITQRRSEFMEILIIPNECHILNNNGYGIIVKDIPFEILDMTPNYDWEEVKKENNKIKGEQIITYMMLMLRKANQASLRISKTDLGKMASKVQYFPGVTTFFPRINKFVDTESNNKIKVRHYIISSGLRSV